MKKYLEATLDLSFASAKWQRTVMVRRKRKSWYIRQHLETCVFSYVAEKLKTGDLCVAGSEQYADYRDQLLSWEECEPKVSELRTCFLLTFISDEKLREVIHRSTNKVEQYNAFEGWITFA